MINMDYSADLPINTMGRRIRTRLYFTSESHLHTVLNALRFAGEEGTNPLLSDRGVAIINSTPELCYLTQIVMRVFEDSRYPLADPRRYRVEILFSPGANATPFHMEENDRETDTARLDTAGLQMIGREGLTCVEVESFFERVILAGGSEDDDPLDEFSAVTANEKKVETLDTGKKDVPVTTASDAIVSELPSVVETLKDVSTSASLTKETRSTQEPEEDAALSALPSPTSGEDKGSSDEDRKLPISSVMARKVFWSTVAVASIALGFSCLYMATTVSNTRVRRWSTRHG